MSRATGSLIGRLGAWALGLLFLTLAIAFSFVLFAVLAALGLGFAIRFWWKTRALRRALRERSMQGAGFDAAPGERETVGVVIEGEAVVVSEAARHTEPVAALLSAPPPDRSA